MLRFLKKLWNAPKRRSQARRILAIESMELRCVPSAIALVGEPSRFLGDAVPAVNAPAGAPEMIQDSEMGGVTRLGVPIRALVDGHAIGDPNLIPADSFVSDDEDLPVPLAAALIRGFNPQPDPPAVALDGHALGNPTNQIPMDSFVSDDEDLPAPLIGDGGDVAIRDEEDFPVFDDASLGGPDTLSAPIKAGLIRGFHPQPLHPGVTLLGQVIKVPDLLPTDSLIGDEENLPAIDPVLVDLAFVGDGAWSPDGWASDDIGDGSSVGFGFVEKTPDLVPTDIEIVDEDDFLELMASDDIGDGSSVGFGFVEKLPLFDKVSRGGPDMLPASIEGVAPGLAAVALDGHAVGDPNVMLVDSAIDDDEDFPALDPVSVGNPDLIPADSFVDDPDDVPAPLAAALIRGFNPQPDPPGVAMDGHAVSDPNEMPGL